jgi:hypothetical protein
MSSYNSERYFIDIINPELSPDQNRYYSNTVKEIARQQFDYLIYSTVYYYSNEIILKVSLINVYTNTIILTEFYNLKDLNQIAEFNSNSASDFIRKFIILDLSVISKKSVKKEETQDLQKNKNINKLYRHEIFISNGFFKNNPIITSYLNWYIGYCFTPLNIINVESAYYFGFGNLDNKLSFSNFDLSQFFTGFYLAAYIFMTIGIIEPNLGLRVEFSYCYPDDRLYINIPIDIGIKIYIDNYNLIRINSSFQYNHYSISENLWIKNYTIGLIIGYARKI